MGIAVCSFLQVTSTGKVTGKDVYKRQVRNSAKLVRDLAKHRRTPMSPPQLIPPTSPGQVIAGDVRLRRRFSRHRTWSVPDVYKRQVY